MNINDKRENWIKWTPVNIPTGEYTVTDFVQNADGVTITLDDEVNILKVYFDGIPSVVRISVEGLRMQTCREALEKYSDGSFFRNWSFYKIENSKLAKWAEEESCGFYEAKDFSHYCIVTMQEVVDILATFPPKVSTTKISECLC